MTTRALYQIAGQSEMRQYQSSVYFPALQEEAGQLLGKGNEVLNADLALESLRHVTEYVT